MSEPRENGSLLVGRGFQPDLTRTSVFRIGYLRANMVSFAFGFTSWALRDGLPP